MEGRGGSKFSGDANVDRDALWSALLLISAPRHRKHWFIRNKRLVYFLFLQLDQYRWLYFIQLPGNKQITFALFCLFMEKKAVYLSPRRRWSPGLRAEGSGPSRGREECLPRSWVGDGHEVLWLWAMPWSQGYWLRRTPKAFRGCWSLWVSWSMEQTFGRRVSEDTWSSWASRQKTTSPRQQPTLGTVIGWDPCLLPLFQVPYRPLGMSLCFRGKRF